MPSNFDGLQPETSTDGGDPKDASSSSSAVEISSGNSPLHLQNQKSKHRLNRQRPMSPSGQFVPRIAKKKKPIDLVSQKKQQFVPQQSNIQQQQQFRHDEYHPHHHPFPRRSPALNQHSHSFQHGHQNYEEELEPNKTSSELLESMLKSTVEQKKRKGDHFTQKKSPQQSPRSTPKKKVKRKLPAGSKKVEAKNRMSHQCKSGTIPVVAKTPRKSAPASKHESDSSAVTKEDEPVASSPSTKIVQRATLTPKVDNTPRPSVKNDEFDMAASVLMQLTLAPPTPLHDIYPVGTRTKKYFEEFSGWFLGTIRSYNEKTRFYSVEYEDSDTEDLEHHEIDTGSLPSPKYEIGTKYDIYFVSKQSGEKIGWFVGEVRSKYYHDPERVIARGMWRYNVVYSDGDSEDVTESYITQTIENSKWKRGRRMLQQPNETEEKEPNEEDSNEEQNKSSSGEEEEDSSSEDEGNDTSSEDEPTDLNPENIPYWSGKQHHQFILGLQEYGLGNLDEIHEANCIPDRSFQELVRYWHWYVSDIEKKGLVLDYERRGTVNGRKGRRVDIEEDTNMEEEKKEQKEEQKEQDDETKNEGYNTGPWADQEIEMISKASVFHGGSYAAMSKYMKTRSEKQVAGYYNRKKEEIRKRSKKYELEASTIVPSAKRAVQDNRFPKRNTWTSGEDALLVEALAIYGPNVDEIEVYMRHRKSKQIQARLNRFQTKLEKQAQVKKQLLKKNFPKRTSAWTSTELAMLLEGHAIFEKDYKRIADYVKTRSENQVKSAIEANPSQYEDESDFDLGDRFSFSIELYHVLNVAPFERFDHILSWNDKGDCVLIHDKAKFSNAVFPRYSYPGTPVQTFYDNLELFGFEQQKVEKGKENMGAFRHSAFKKEEYKKVEQLCRKSFA